MGREELVGRILEDAQREADAIGAQAAAKAEQTLAAARARAQSMKQAADEALEAQCASIRAGMQAAARLDHKKIVLAERRRAMDAVYERAWQALCSLDREQTLALTQRLIEQYAEEGDEIVFAENYPYVQEAAKLPVAVKKKLVLSPVRAGNAGGFLIRGKAADIDLSYRALLDRDRARNEAELAKQLFKE